MISRTWDKDSEEYRYTPYIWRFIGWAPLDGKGRLYPFWPMIFGHRAEYRIKEHATSVIRQHYNGENQVDRRTKYIRINKLDIMK